MALSPIAICSRALLKLGAASIASFDDGTAEAEITGNLYEGVRDALLSTHPWNFATGQVALARLAVEPVADFAYAFQLPGDFLRALSVGHGGAGRGVIYRIAERRLHTNSPDVVLSYIFRPVESEYPPFFAQLLVARLAAEFCIPLTESTSRAESLLKIFESDLRRARNIDAQQDTPGRIEDFTLIGARG